jgi:hypothetical protein
MGERQSRNEKRYMTEAQALGSALQDALADLVQVHGVQYLDVFLERRLRDRGEITTRRPHECSQHPCRPAEHG